MSTGPLLTVEIDGIAGGGDGVGRLDDGRVVFVPRTAPGDEVTVRPVKDGGRWLRAEVERIDRASELRVEPPCRLYDRCGGCQLQHLEYSAQLAAGSRNVGDALRRIGGLDVADPPVHGAPSPFGYRNRVSITLKRLRNGRVVAGFHARGRPGHIVDLNDECLLPEPAIARVWPRLRERWGRGASLLPPGGELRLTLRTVEGGAMLAIEGGRPGGNARQLADEVEELQAIWHRPSEGKWRWVGGEEQCHDTQGGERVTVRPGAFTQVNREVAQLLQQRVLDAIGPAEGLRIVDGYCGVGLHGRRLARDGAEVIGLELDPTAIEVALDRAPEGFRVIEGPAEGTLASVLPADAVILNPPRSGLHAGVPEALRDLPPQRIVYVSCDPATLARDLKRLGSLWAVRDVVSFDLFPQTSHIETVVTLELDPSATES